MAGQTAGSKTADKLKREQFVELLGMTASSLEVQASVLPTKQLDPRFSNGNEVVRLDSGTSFSGEYQLTEVITTYEGGKRSRDIAGIGIKIDGLTAVKDPSDSSKSSASKAVNTKPTVPNKPNSNSGSNGGGKSNTPTEQLKYDIKGNKWTS